MERLKYLPVLFVLSLFSCNEEDDKIINAYYNTPILATIGADSSSTRIVYNEENNQLKFFWSKEDSIYITFQTEGTTEKHIFVKETKEISNTATFIPLKKYWCSFTNYGASTFHYGSKETLNGQNGDLSDYFFFHKMNGKYNYNDHSILFEHVICLLNYHNLSFPELPDGTEIKDITISSDGLSDGNGNNFLTLSKSYFIKDGVIENLYFYIYPNTSSTITITANINGNSYSNTYKKPVSFVKGNVYKLSNRKMVLVQ